MYLFGGFAEGMLSFNLQPIQIQFSSEPSLINTSQGNLFPSYSQSQLVPNQVSLVNTLSQNHGSLLQQSAQGNTMNYKQRTECDSSGIVCVPSSATCDGVSDDVIVYADQLASSHHQHTPAHHQHILNAPAASSASNLLPASFLEVSITIQ